MHRTSEGQAPADQWPKIIWLCDHCGHWHGASYNSWDPANPTDRPLCKVKGYGRDSKSSCGRPMRPVEVWTPAALGRQLSELEGLRPEIDVPAAILIRVLGRHARLAKLRNRDAPSVLIEREEDLLAEALNALQEVGRDRGWVDSL